MCALGMGGSIWNTLHKGSTPNLYYFIRVQILSYSTSKNPSNYCIHVLVHVTVVTEYLLSLYVNVPCSYEGCLKEANRLGVKKGLSVGVSLGMVFFLIFLVDAAAFW